MITETWLSTKFSDSDISCNLPYIVLRKDRVVKKGGGVCALIHEQVIFEHIKFDSKLACDVLAFDIYPEAASRHRFILVYRPPASNIHEDKELISLLEDLSSTACEVTILGDLNLSDIEWSSMKTRNSSSAEFLALFNSLGLNQLVDSPTRGNSILDVILSSSSSLSVNEILPPLGYSDHNIITFSIAMKNPDKCIDKHLDFSMADVAAIKAELSSIDWFQVFANYTDVNDVYTRFIQVLHKTISRFVPYRKPRDTFEHYPPHIVNLFDQKRRLFCETVDPLRFENYKNVCQKLNYHLKRFLSYRERKMSLGKNIKKLFSQMKFRISNKRCPPSLEDELGNKFVKASEKADALARYFSTVFNNASSSCPVIDSLSSTECPTPCIEVNEVRKYLKASKGTFSLTSDQIPPFFFKKFADQLCRPLSHIFNISLITGEVPLTWKKAIITPIPKIPLAVNVSDFRPISILPTPCRIMEKIIAKSILEWCLKIRCIPEEQHGFLPSCSTSIQLIQCYQDWVTAVSEGKYVEVVYFDLSKAFDTVDHLSLLRKLESIGVKNNLLKWFESYLSDRKFAVRVQEQLSSENSSPSGVPQGSVLSPLLFNIYSMDIANFVKTDPRIRIAAYADDIKIYAAYNALEKQEIRAKLRQSIEQMLSWAQTWRIKVNTSKSHVLMLGGNNEQPEYGIPIKKVDSIRDLGVLVDCSLKYSQHIEELAARARRIMHCILRNLHTSEVSVLVKLYKAYVLPVLEYCSQLWNPVLKKEIQKIEKIQKTFTRIVFYRAFPNEGYPQAMPDYKARLQVLGLKSLIYRRAQADVIMGFKILRGEVRLKPSQLWIFRPKNDRRFSINLLPSRSGRWHSNLQRNSFAYRTSQFLNKLPPFLAASKDSKTLKKRIRNMNLLSLLGLEDIA
ncbi:hypothetical protein Y032_0033g2652 [Ancylostoma ceylanicum]|uniref:Reverse transcriptase domain-containing protein n=1 Tax=Ancylostoma ceylanicum TaxID=53326 RepID=A0A016UMK5_9BILA|nr:hypothetical protein Y032_0033g2652 [Ancylostoma ceylanicum]